MINLMVMFNIFSDAQVKIFNKDPIKLSFETNGYNFFRGYKGLIGKPPEAFLKLVAVKNNKRTLISNASELKGYVKIITENEALEFVRFLTNINTHYLFDDVNYIEVLDKNEKADTSCGLIDHENYLKFKLFKPKTAKDKSGFIIERCLYNTKREIFQSIEKVGFDGSYSIKINKIIIKDYPLQYPYYE
jgi:hypothetical protein